jgi:hypothetical protein
MARLCGRLLAVALAFSVLVLAARGIGAARHGWAQIAFTYYSDGSNHTYLLDVLHGVRYHVMHERDSVALVGWQDGNHLVAIVNDQVPQPHVLQVGGGWRQMTVGEADSARLTRTDTPPSEAWTRLARGTMGPIESPDGAWLALMRRVSNGFFIRLYVMDSDGRSQRLTRGVLDLDYAWRPAR